MLDKEKLKKIEQLANKWAVAEEFFEDLVRNDWVELPYIAKRAVNQIGKQLLEIIGGKKNSKTEKAEITG